MQWLFLMLLVSAVAQTEKVNKEEEAKKAAEVLGATYVPPEKKDESIINFETAEAMNDEEKSVVFANYERTKGEYKEDSSDTLFERISKAYVRNLDRVLVRKKE